MQVAPAPCLAALEGGDDRMTRRIEVLKRMRMRRILAASDMTTRETYAKLVPRCAERDALLAAVRPRLHLSDLTEMFAAFGHC